MGQHTPDEELAFHLEYIYPFVSVFGVWLISLSSLCRRIIGRISKKLDSCCILFNIYKLYGIQILQDSSSSLHELTLDVTLVS